MRSEFLVLVDFIVHFEDFTLYVSTLMIDFHLYYVDKNHSALILQLWPIIFSVESIITFSINLQPQLFIVDSPSQLLELHVYCGSKFHPSTH